MAVVHGRGSYFALDLADGTGPSAIHGVKLRRIGGLPGKADRPNTDGFADDYLLYEVLGKLDGGPISLAGVWQRVAGTPAHGRQARILHDEFSLSGKLRSATINRSMGLDMTDGFGDDWRKRETIGKGSGSLSIGGNFDAAAGLTDAVYRAALVASTPGVVSVGIKGFTIGELIELISAYETAYDIPTQHDQGPVPISAEFLPDGRIDLGVSLHELIAETGTGTTNYAGVDEVAVSTAFGWVAHLHVTAYSTWTNAIFKVQDSADGAAWADLSGATFATITAVGKQRLVGAATATVRRHVRAVCTTTGASGSVTFAIAFARRGSTYGAAGTYRHLYELLGLATSSSFQYGPEGSASGKRRITGECRLSTLGLSIQHDAGPIEYTADGMTDGTLTFDVF